MLRYFLDQQPLTTPSQKKLISKLYKKRRKYNAFHLECQYTKQKLCYCKRSPIEKMSVEQKVDLWTKQYMDADLFYDKEAQLLTQEAAKVFYNGDNKQKQEEAERFVIEDTKQSFERCMHQIRNLTREECVNFVRSIREGPSVEGGQQPS